MENQHKPYTGAKDAFLQFANNDADFTTGVKHLRAIIFSIKNTGDEPRDFLLCPGLLTNAVGLMADGPFNDINGKHGLVGEPKYKTIALINAFVQKTPMLVTGLKINTANIKQMDVPLVITEEGLFENADERAITPSRYASESNFNPYIQTVPEHFFMTAHTKISYSLLGNTSVTITLVVTAVLNTSAALKKKVRKYKKTHKNNK